MLILRNVSAGYGGPDVIAGVSLEVPAGRVVSVLGANGAGKSTLAGVISGLLSIRAGEIAFQGERIDSLTPKMRVARGIVHVPEGRQVFAGLSVLDNLELGSYAARTKSRPTAIADRIDWVCTIFGDLRQSLNKPAGALSGGQQQMLAVARGLMAEPKLLILDEPSLGLSPAFVTRIFKTAEELRHKGIAILLSEQNAYASLKIADYGYLLELGRVVLEGTSAALLQNQDLAERYLGLGSSAGRVDQALEADMTRRLRAILASAA
jgi:branched-chain amino acid transport system ATP-binding protein